VDKFVHARIVCVARYEDELESLELQIFFNEYESVQRRLLISKNEHVIRNNPDIDFVNIDRAFHCILRHNELQTLDGPIKKCYIELEEEEGEI